VTLACFLTVDLGELGELAQVDWWS